MKTTLSALIMLTLSGCYMPTNFSFDVPITNKTNISSIHCGNWNKISDNMVKSTCHFDNKNSAELKPVEIRAYDKQGFLIGKALVGKATIGEKVRINKAMVMERLEEPSTMTLETVDVM
jgi:hypothetical protein